MSSKQASNERAVENDILQIAALQSSLITRAFLLLHYAAAMAGYKNKKMMQLVVRSLFLLGFSIRLERSRGFLLESNFLNVAHNRLNAKLILLF